MKSILTAVILCLGASSQANAIACTVQCRVADAYRGVGTTILDISSYENYDSPHYGDYSAYCSSLGGVTERASTLKLSCRRDDAKKNLLLCYKWNQGAEGLSATGYGSGADLIEARENGRASCLANMNFNDPQTCEVGKYVNTSNFAYNYSCQ
jgi:hypothetical protein